MSVSEARRLEMYVAFQQVLGDEVADTVMEHLPPSGWNDLVRLRDVLEIDKRLDGRLNEVEKRLNGRLDEMEKRLDGRIASLNGRVTLAISCGLTFGLALLAIQVQIMLSIANL